MARRRKVDQESYVEVDHRDSPGISHEEAARVGSKLAVGKGQHFKSAVRKCSHCEYMIILNPDRSRSRGYCPSCDFDICDRCSLLMKLGHPCRPFKKVIEGILNRAAKGQTPWLAESQPKPPSLPLPSPTQPPSPLDKLWASGKEPQVPS